jgi:2-polyprenyl-6-methoxyphenol hydroxylase-like FAD-dependent oxidoreductase
MAPRTSNVESNALCQYYRCGPDLIGLLPSGRNADGTEVVSWFRNARIDELEGISRRGFSAWVDESISVCAESGRVLVSLSGFGDVPFWRYSTVAMNRCHTARSVLIGDAAHALNPQLGMGANLALVDAKVLAESLDGAGARDIPRSLAQHDANRDPQIQFYRTAGTLLDRFLGAESRLPLWATHAMLRSAARIPAVRRRALSAICGYN